MYEYPGEILETLSSHSPTQYQLDDLEGELALVEAAVNRHVVRLIELKAARRKLKKKLKTWGRL